jgi:hypothetical protein
MFDVLVKEIRMINILVHLDDETKKLDEEDWEILEGVIHMLVEDRARQSQSTEPTYILRAVGSERVSYIKGRIAEHQAEDIYQRIQALLLANDLKTSVSVMLADFNQSIIVTAEKIEPWTAYIQG